MRTVRAQKTQPMTLEEVRRIALSFPGVEEGPCYGTAGFRVRGKFMARMRDDDQTLVIKLEPGERDLLMERDPTTFFITEHYRGYPTILVRLSKVDPDDLRELLLHSWRMSAPKRLVAAYQTGDKSTPPRIESEGRRRRAGSGVARARR